MALIDNIALYYKFDSSNSNDSVGSNNGTDTAITYSSGNGRINIGAGFNGTTSKIQTASVPVTGTNLSCTYNIWFKTSSASRQEILNFGDNSTNNDGMQVYIYTDNKLHCDFTAVGGGNSTATVNDGVWHMATVVVNGGGGQLYFDGATAGASFGGGKLDITSNGTNSRDIGVFTYGGDVTFFNGALDEFGAWSRALSGAEVTELYNGGIGKQYPFTSLYVSVNDTVTISENVTIGAHNYLISYDTASSTSVTVSSATHTFSHTIGTGLDRILWVVAGCHTSVGSISGVTFNSVAMTQSGSAYSDGGNGSLSLWYLVAPATGAHNVIVTCTGSTGNVSGGGVSFFGVSQTAVPDATITGESGATTSFSQSVTTIADSCWSVWGLFCWNGLALTPGANTTVGSQPEVIFHGTASAYRSSAKTPPGTSTLNVTSASQGFTGVMASFAPFGPPSTFYINLSDSVTISESISITLLFTPVLYINLSDSITVSENTTVYIIVYATWNPSDIWGGASLSNGNLTLTNTADTTWASGRSTVSKSSGKWYWEYTFTSSSGFLMSGIAHNTAGGTNFIGADIDGWSYYGFNGKKYNDGVSTAYGATYGNGTVIGIALDMDAGTITEYKDNVSQGVMFSGLTGAMFAGVSVYSINAYCVANFGATALTYTPPTGFNAGLYTYNIAALIINVSDSITVSENIVLGSLLSINLYDSITVSENISLIPVYCPNTFDSITVSENVSIFVPVIYINTIETITLTENILLIFPIIELNISDSITISDIFVISSSLTILVDIFDSVTVSGYCSFITKIYGYDLPIYRPRGGL